MSRTTKPPPDAGDEQVRTTVSMTKKFWHDDVEKLMQEEGFNNFSSYMAFLVKLRRENLHQRRMEVDRLEGIRNTAAGQPIPAIPAPVMTPAKATRGA